MNKQPEITERTRQIFVDVFCELYSQKPIEKISVQELARKVGYNRSTFYLYFSDLYELREYVENDLLCFIKHILEDEEFSARPFLKNVLYLFEEKEKSINALLGDYGNIRFLERVKGEMPAVDPKSRLSEDSPFIPYLTEFHVSTILSLFRLWVRRDKDISVEKLLKLMETLYTTGILGISENM